MPSRAGKGVLREATRVRLLKKKQLTDWGKWKRVPLVKGMAHTQQESIPPT